MARTLILYDSGNPLLEKAADIAGCFASLVKCVTPETLSRPEEYYNWVLLCDGSRGPSEQLLACLPAAGSKLVSLLTVGADVSGCHEKAEDMLKKPILHSAVLEPGWVQADGYCEPLLSALQSFMACVDAPISVLPREELKERIDSFILAHDSCAFSCAAEGFVRNTALDFRYVDGKIYIVSEGGQKFRALLRDNRVSVLIYDSPKRGGSVTSVQIAGYARRLEMWSDEYVAALNKTWGNVEKHRASLIRLNVLEIVPTKIEYFSYTLRGKGVDLKETYYPD